MPRVFALLWCCCFYLATATVIDGHAEAVARLKADIHKLSPEEIRARFAEVTPGIGDLPPPHQDKIQHFVVFLMENHAFDSMLGCMMDELGPGIDGIPLDGKLVPKDPDNPTNGSVLVSCGTADYVCKGGPGYNLFSGKFRPGTNSESFPYSEQSDDFSYENGLANPVGRMMFAPKQIPVKVRACRDAAAVPLRSVYDDSDSDSILQAELAREYGVFNRLFTSVPAASNPNHLYIQSATSCGIIDNIMYSDCGGSTDTFPQVSK